MAPGPLRLAYISQGSNSTHHPDRRGGVGRRPPGYQSGQTGIAQRHEGLGFGCKKVQVRMGRVRNLAGERKHGPWASLELPDANRAVLWQRGERDFPTAPALSRCLMSGTVSVRLTGRCTTGCTLLRQAAYSQVPPAELQHKDLQIFGSFQLVTRPDVGGI